ncbi:MAG: cupin domain-containing protein [Burkholderiales bacterium]
MTALPAPDDDSDFEPDLAEALLREGAPVDPPGAVRERLRARVLAGARPTGPWVDGPDFATVFSDDGRWVPIADKVEMRIVRKEDDVLIALYRLQPGGVIPPHRHPGREESFILQGTVDIGPLHCTAGDYHVARAGSVHPVVTSASGCLFLARHAMGMPQPL